MKDLVLIMCILHLSLVTRQLVIMIDDSYQLLIAFKSDKHAIFKVIDKVRRNPTKISISKYLKRFDHFVDGIEIFFKFCLNSFEF